MPGGFLLRRSARLVFTAVFCTTLATAHLQAGELLGISLGGLGIGGGGGAGSSDAGQGTGIGGAVGAVGNAVGNTVSGSRQALGAVSGALGAPAGVAASVSSRVTGAANGASGVPTSPRHLGDAEFTALLQKSKVLLHCKKYGCAPESRSQDAGPRLTLRQKTQLLSACSRVFENPNGHHQETLELCEIVTTL